MIFKTLQDDWCETQNIAKTIARWTLYFWIIIHQHITFDQSWHCVKIITSLCPLKHDLSDIETIFLHRKRTIKIIILDKIHAFAIICWEIHWDLLSGLVYLSIQFCLFETLTKGFLLSLRLLFDFFRFLFDFKAFVWNFWLRHNLKVFA